MALTFWSLAIPLGAAAVAYYVKPKASSLIAGAAIGLVGYYAIAVARTQTFQNSVPYGIAPIPYPQIVPSQNPQAYSPLVVSGRQAGTDQYIF